MADNLKKVMERLNKKKPEPEVEEDEEEESDEDDDESDEDDEEEEEKQSRRSPKKKVKKEPESPEHTVEGEVAILQNDGIFRHQLLILGQSIDKHLKTIADAIKG